MSYGCSLVRLLAVPLSLVLYLKQQQPVIAQGTTNATNNASSWLSSPQQQQRQEQEEPRNRWCDNMWTLTYRNKRQRLSRINVKTGQWTQRPALSNYDPERYASALAVDPRNDKLYTVVDIGDFIRSGILIQEIIPRTGKRIEVAKVWDINKSFGIAINSKGVMYVSFWDSPPESTVWAIDLDDPQNVTKFPHIQGPWPKNRYPGFPPVLTDIEFDRNDNLFALAYDGALLKVNLETARARVVGRLRPRSRNVPDSTALHINAISFHKNGKLYGLAGNTPAWFHRGMPNPPVYEIAKKPDGRYRVVWPSAETQMDWAVGGAFLCRRV